jgi:uncharacterized protein YkwD
VRLALVLIAATLVLGVADARALPREDRASAAGQIAEMPGLQGEVLATINALRRSKGLGALRLNRSLSLAALGHSVSMAKHGFFEHSGWDAASFGRRLKLRYPPLPHASWEVGENMVWASPGLSAVQTVQLWLNSRPHRQILLAPSWREIGLGSVHVVGAPGVYEGLDVTILTADFGVR